MADERIGRWFADDNLGRYRVDGFQSHRGLSLVNITLDHGTPTTVITSKLQFNTVEMSPLEVQHWRKAQGELES